MTTPSSDTPETNPSSTATNPEWVHSVVSEALVQASAPEGNSGGHGQGNPHADPFASQPKPQADDWPELQAAARADANKARLAETRSATFEAAPVAAPVPSAVVLEREPVPALTATLPTLEAEGTSIADLQPPDAVLEETEASIVGYRQSTVRTLVEWLVVVFLALVVAVLAKEFIVQAFWIPSESMETTVNVGDRVLVNKLSYNFNDVRRGDLVVFSKVDGTQSDTEDLIKRAVALPGETIELRSDGRLWIWGPGETPDDALLLNEPYLDPQNQLLNAPSATDSPTATIWHENCANDGSNPARCTLDDASYFMMGDNRGRSLDSRGFGPVPEDNLIGRAFFRIWPLGAISSL